MTIAVQLKADGVEVNMSGLAPPHLITNYSLILYAINFYKPLKKIM